MVDIIIVIVLVLVVTVGVILFVRTDALVFTVVRLVVFLVVTVGVSGNNDGSTLGVQLYEMDLAKPT